MHRPPGVAAAVFPHQPERAVYNNALLDRDLAPGERAEAIDAMEAVYAAAGVDRFAAWVHESDGALRAELEPRGYTLDTTTRAMGMALDDIALPRRRSRAGAAGLARVPAWLRASACRPISSAPPTRRLPPAGGPRDGETVAAALAYDYGDDCGIYNVGTVEQARRRGLGTALTAAPLHDARDRGCRTASLQSTPMAERVYAAVGFRDLGRILEYVPS